MNIEQLLNIAFVVVPLFAFLVVGVRHLKSTRQKIVMSAFAVLVIGIFTAPFLMPTSFLSREMLQEYASRLGLLGILFVLGLQVVQVVIPPLDHNVVGMIGGFLFGPWLGFVYNFVGRTIGSLIAFGLARTYGRPFISRVASSEQVEKYDRIWDKNLVYVFLAYWLPFFPDDTISYLAGASRVKMTTFVLMLLLGHPIGTLGVSFMGSFGTTEFFKTPTAWIVALSTLIVGIGWFYIQQRKIRNSDRTHDNANAS